MGFRDKINELAAEQREISSGARQAFEYDAEVNKKSINMSSYAVMLNGRAKQGWRLHTAFEQDGNTVSIFERPVARDT